MTIASMIHRIRRQARAIVRNLPGIRHNIAAARRARITGRAPLAGQIHRQLGRKAKGE